MDLRRLVFETPRHHELCERAAILLRQAGQVFDFGAGFIVHVGRDVDCVHVAAVQVFGTLETQFKRGGGGK